MEITKRNDFMPMMMEMMQGGMPIQVPELPFNKDPISKMFYNLSLRQISKAESLKAEIATSRNIQAQNYLETMQRAILFGDTVFEEKQKMKDEQERRQAEIQKIKAEARQTFYDSKIAEMDFEMREIQFKKMKKEEME